MINLNLNEVADAVKIVKEPIPHKHVARAVLKIKYNPNPIPNEDPAIYKTPNTGSLYTEFEWTLIDTQYAGRKFWDTMWWTQATIPRTRGLLLRIVEDNYAINSKDESPEVLAVRDLKSLSEIDGFEACVVIALNEGSINEKTGEKYSPRNALLTVINTQSIDYIQRKSPPKPIPTIQHTPQPPSIEGAELSPADQIVDDEIPF